MIELVTVMAIIVLLAGLAVGGASLVSRRTADAKCRSQFEQLKTAFELYRQEFGYFPLSGTSSNKRWINISEDFVMGAGTGGSRRHGLEKPTKDGGNWVVGPYLMDVANLKFRGGDLVGPYKDPGNGDPMPYRYSFPGIQSGDAHYDIWACGHDGQWDTADDIKTWRRD